MTEDEWVSVAMADDTLVVQLLLKLNQPETRLLPPPPSKKNPVPALRLDWTVRQRRSKQLQIPRKKPDEATRRASPTTPLSWSGGTSASGCAADGFEESSSHLVKSIDNARSKIVNETPTTKRSRKKKTLPEIKEEETLLLKENRHLKNQLAKMRLTFEKERAANEKWKRLKFDFFSRQPPEPVISVVKTEEIKSNQQEQIKVASCSVKPITCNKLEPSSPNASYQKQKVESKEFSFMLPDLNLPVDDS